MIECSLVETHSIRSTAELIPFSSRERLLRLSVTDLLWKEAGRSGLEILLPDLAPPISTDAVRGRSLLSAEAVCPYDGAPLLNTPLIPTEHSERRGRSSPLFQRIRRRARFSSLFLMLFSLFKRGRAPLFPSPFMSEIMRSGQCCCFRSFGSGSSWPDADPSFVPCQLFSRLPSSLFLRESRRKFSLLPREEADEIPPPCYFSQSSGRLWVPRSLPPCSRHTPLDSPSPSSVPNPRVEASFPPFFPLLSNSGTPLHRASLEGSLFPRNKECSFLSCSGYPLRDNLSRALKGTRAVRASRGR